MQKSHLVALGGLLVALVAMPTSGAAQDAAALYKSKCAKCHGPTGAGDGPAAKTMKLQVKDLNDPKTLEGMDDAKLMELFKKGEGKMPKFDTLSEADLKALIEYTRAMAKK
ncbi:MAG TPA: cytochrome c [Gemmatimonadales bacterium]|nr:cytochrome c [Gemmatimonadales bacterium]